MLTFKTMRKIRTAYFVALGAISLATFTSCEKETPFERQETSDLSNKRVSSEGNITVSGGGTTVEFGKKTTYEFNAVQREDKTTGHILLKFRAASGSLWVNVDCVRLWGDNKATLSGIITKLHIGPNPNPDFLPPPFIFIGGRVSFTVQDNGEGGNATDADMVSDIGELPGTTASCSDEWPVYLPLDGNVQINN
jgi:hypothetical protein